MLNDIVVEALYERKDVLGRVLLEEDPQNPNTLHEGERVMITHNLSNIQGIVNYAVCWMFRLYHIR